MTIRGYVRDGAVVLEPGIRLAEGIEVRVETLDGATKNDADTGGRRGLSQFAGLAKGLPPDLACNHDHYIHGTRIK